MSKTKVEPHNYDFFHNSFPLVSFVTEMLNATFPTQKAFFPRRGKGYAVAPTEE